MSNLFESASRVLTETLFKSGSSSVVYELEDVEIAVKAIVGRIDRKEEEVEQFGTKYEERDFLIRASELLDDDAPVIPKQGHVIRLTQGGEVRRYEVNPTGISNKPCWEWSDQFCEVRRIHTKFVGIEQ